MICLNEDVSQTAPREKFNLSLPTALMERFEAAATKYGGRRKYLTFAAAMIAFIEMDEAARDYYVGQVSQAELSDSFDLLIDRAQSGALRQEAKQNGRAAARRMPRSGKPFGRS